MDDVDIDKIVLSNKVSSGEKNYQSLTKMMIIKLSCCHNAPKQNLSNKT